MTAAAITAWQGLRDQYDDLLSGLTDDEWLAPSACAGWRVRDVVAHLGASARAVVDPQPEPGDAVPMPADRERQHDVLVDRRREWPLAEVRQEFQTCVPKFAGVLGGLQEGPGAERQVSVPGLGTYAAHMLANANVFDYYCHLRHDLLAPGGPLQRDLGPADHATLYAAVQWMMWGLPQMQGHALDDTVTAPVTIALTGPGQSVWTVSRPQPGGGLVVQEGEGGEVVVTSDAHAFVAWGTTRSPWRRHCTVTGPEELAVPLLDALDIV